MILTSWNRYRDIGLLILRVGLGGMFVFVHGGPKMLAGPELWGRIGMAMGNVGVHFAPTFWGFAAAFAELAGGILLILGFFFRPALALLVFTMFVAATTHLANPQQGIKVASHAIEVGIVFLGLILVGPGKYSLDEAIRISTNRAA